MAKRSFSKSFPGSHKRKARPRKASQPLSYGFPPLISPTARVLILGTLPSRISIERAEYYANPQNKFWRIIAAGDSDFPQDYGQRAARLSECGIALWDVLAAAKRDGSLDIHITEPVPNHFSALFHSHPTIRLICFNGQNAADLYRRHVIPTLSGLQRSIDTRTLPSTSGAHARLNLTAKAKQWSIVWKPNGESGDSPELCASIPTPVTPIATTEPNTYRVRFRFRLQKKLSLSEKERRLVTAGREVVLSPSLPDTDIADSEWLVMNARGFETEEEATTFARKLKAASELSSVVARLGINAGVDKPTSGFGKIVVDDVFEKHGIVLRSNVHGVDVFLDNPNIRIGSFSATGVVRSAPDPFLSDIDDLYKVVDDASQRSKDIVLLLNYALTRTDPVAMIVFAVSAVEMLGQDEDWSDGQKELLESLAASASASSVVTEAERAEVADAIRRGTHKLGLRQGVLRLLASLGLSSLKSKWDALYKERSTLVHGLAPQPGVDYSDLAFRTMSLCGHILLTAIAREVSGADKHLDKYYPL